MREADDRGLGHGLVLDQGALDLGGAEAVAGDVDHVVDAAGDPVVAVVVAAAAVAGEVEPGKAGEVGLVEAFVVAPDGPRLARPGAVETEIAGDLVALEDRSLVIDHAPV